MEELTKNKIFKFLFLLFIIISIFHIGYTMYTGRGMYMDGSYYFLTQLCNLSQNIYTIVIDADHPRFCIMALMQIPVILTYLIDIKSKFFLMGVYSFSQFGLPFLFLIWNYFLTKRTQRTDVLLGSIFCYGGILCLFMIFGITETIIGVVLNFVLWNYLSAKIDYKKRDVFFIILLLIIMVGTWEYTIYIGVFFFIAHFLYASREENKFNKKIKRLIGFGSLFAAVFDLVYILRISDETEEIMRFVNESINYWSQALNINLLITIVTVVLLFAFFFKKKNMGIWSLLGLFACYISVLSYLLVNSDRSIMPMWEIHCRSLSCIVPFIIYICIYIKDLRNKPFNTVRINNYICIALICCIFQTCWQIIETYYWERNIQYMRNELSKEDGLLYFPQEHEEISSFFNKDLRRHIWHSTYSALSILFSKDYELKTLLMLYPETVEPGNDVENDLLYVFNNGEEDFLVVPYGSNLPYKTVFWDVTKCAEALKKYNKEHNINQNQ